MNCCLMLCWYMLVSWSWVFCMLSRCTCLWFFWLGEHIFLFVLCNGSKGEILHWIRWHKKVLLCFGRWFMKYQHVDPEEAVRIHIDVQAKKSVAIHWGTFALANEVNCNTKHEFKFPRTRQSLVKLCLCSLTYISVNVNLKCELCMSENCYSIYHCSKQCLAFPIT